MNDIQLCKAWTSLWRKAFPPTTPPDSALIESLLVEPEPVLVNAYIRATGKEVNEILQMANLVVSPADAFDLIRLRITGQHWNQI